MRHQIRLFSILAAVFLLLFACKESTNSNADTGITPEQLDDGISVASLPSQGLNEAQIMSLSDRIGSEEFGQISSMLIYRNGHLVFEDYYQDHSRNQLHIMYSVTKSVSSILIGIAQDKGFLGELDQSIETFFPQDQPIFEKSPEKRDITLNDLLPMTAGLEWDEWSWPYGDTRNNASQMAGSSDWVAYVLEKPVVAEPSDLFTYSSGVSVLLSEVLLNTTEVHADEFAKTHLLDPLGITDYLWHRTGEGLANTGWGLHLRTRDLLKIGIMCLNGGVWNDQRVVSESWLNASRAVTSQVNSEVYYGYQWWLRGITQSPPSNEIYYGHGYGGQFLFIVPGENLVAAFTSENYNNGNESNPIGILYDDILTAIE